MKRSGLLARFDQGRLRLVLSLFFLALAIPTAILIYQAYSQLKWEAFDQHRRLAEEFARRVDTRVVTLVEQEERRSVADYQFLVLTGDPAANFLQRSPLAEFPVTRDIPGLMGFFDVDSDGRLTTPLLPASGTDPATFGLGPDEYTERLAAQQLLQDVLTENRLVRSRAAESVSLAAASSPRPGEDARRSLASAGGEDVPVELPEKRETGRASVSSDEAIVEEDAGIGFDGLRQMNTPQATANREAKLARGKDLGRVEDLELDATLEEKSRDLDAKRSPVQTAAGSTPAQRLRRKEQTTLPQTAVTVTTERVADATDDADLEQPEARFVDERKGDETMVAGTPLERQVAGIASDAAGLTTPKTNKLIADRVSEPVADDIAGGAAGQITLRAYQGAATGSQTGLRVMTFESEIDPFEFSLLDSGHFVLFRRVLRDGRRHIQGALIEQRSFLDGLFEDSFRATALSRTSDLLIALGGEVFTVFPGGGKTDFVSESVSVSGALLFRHRLPPPLDGMEMVFTLNELPAGPGGRVINWVSVILTVVLVGGFYLLYRLGSGQIALARQQQDFVSAVSHELKTPLTSIRMYGEMLKSGWADEEKKRTYYDYIHDESERLSRLIDNVLQLARLTRNDPSFDLQTVPVGELLDITRSKIGDHVQRAGFTLEVIADADTKSRQVRVDTDCFIQIVINLVDNAIKFATGAERKLIRVGAIAGNDRMVSFTVRDFGPGIPGDQRRKIFRLFYRSENELTRETVGTGIGLALVHQLTLAMRGTIDVRNREPGAEFRVSLPVVSD